MSGDGGEEDASLEYTPTWVVAVVCTVIVAISLSVERLLHFLGKYLKKKNQKPLFQALQKVKEELMLMGFISLLLTVFQNLITKFCVPKDVVSHLLPCKPPEESHVTHWQRSLGRHLLSSESSSSSCAHGKVPLLSVEALHHLHIFIFVLAIVHVTFCVLTVVFGGAKIRQWKHWEDSIAKQNYDPEEALKKKVTHVHEHAFIKDHFLGIGKNSALLSWVHSFFKQFYASVTKSDYLTLRLGFIMTHCRGNPKFNFHKYMVRALEDDFKRVVGISWYLWIFVVVFLLLNVDGWHTYFWIAFIPFVVDFSILTLYLRQVKSIKKTVDGFKNQLFVLLLAVGMKLEHVISQLAHEVAEKHVAIEGDLVVLPSDDHFWFHRPRIVLFLIHIILFQNSFEIAFFFWIWFTYGFNSCIMGKVGYIIPRLIIGAIIQVLCSYSTLPLYAIVTQMGTHFKKAIFDEHVQAGVVAWAQKAKRGLKTTGKPNQGSTIQLGKVARSDDTKEETGPTSAAGENK